MVKLNLEPEWIRIIRLITTVEDMLLGGLATTMVGNQVPGGTQALHFLHLQLTDLWLQLRSLPIQDQVDILRDMMQQIEAE